MSSALSFEIPSWMDKTYFEKVLRRYTNDESIILDEIMFQPASKAGNGFASTIFRVICVYKQPLKRVSLIVKTVPVEEGLKKHMINQERAYETEIKMYVDVLPEMERVLFEAIGTRIQIGPRRVHHALTPSPVLILEDLVEAGCEMPETTLGYDESLMIVKRLAQFHAVSIFINEKRLNLTNIRNSFFHIDKEKDFNIAELRLQPSVEMFVEAVELRQNYHPKVVERLKYFAGHFVELLERVYVSIDNKKYFALTHNDYHRKNMMFKMKNDKIDDFYLVSDHLSIRHRCDPSLFHFSSIISSVCGLRP